MFTYKTKKLEIEIDVAKIMRATALVVWLLML